MTIKRGFADIGSELQVHYRTAGKGNVRPVIILHPSPGSSKMMETLITAFGDTREVFALDTLGNGDSSAPAELNPDIAFFSRAHIAAIDALRIDKFDLYGSHTGALIAAEIALALPHRVCHLILDGVSNFTDEQRADLLANHAPPLAIMPDATHLLWVWNFVRDAFLFWPWYRRDAQHLRGIDLPSTDLLHDKFVEVIKAARSFHLSYNAAIAYDNMDRFSLITVPTMLTCADSDMLMEYFNDLAELMPNAEQFISTGLSEGTRSETVARFITFLDS